MTNPTENKSTESNFTENKEVNMHLTEPLEQAASEIENQVLPQLKLAKTKLVNLDAQVTTYIRANPGRCLLGAVAAGYLIGKIARRK